MTSSSLPPADGLPLHQRLYAMFSSPTPPTSSLQIQVDDCPTELHHSSTHKHATPSPLTYLTAPPSPTHHSLVRSSSPSLPTSASCPVSPAAHQLVPSSFHPSLLSSSKSSSSSPISLHSVATTLSHLLHANALQHEEQAAINATSNTLHTFHFLVSYAHMSHTRTLEHRQRRMADQLESGKRLLADLTLRLADQEALVHRLESDVDCLAEDARAQRDKWAQLSLEVDSQKEAVRLAMAAYDSRMQAQEAQLRAQEERLERLLLVRFRLDAAVDVAIVAAALYLSRLGLVRLLLRAVAVRAVGVGVAGARTKREALAGAAQLLVFTVLVRRARAWAVEHGVHHTVGSYSAYGQWLLTSVQAAAYRVVEGKPQPQEPSPPYPNAEGAGEARAENGKVEEGKALVALPPPYEKVGVEEEGSGPAGVVLAAAGDVVGGVISGAGQAAVEAGRLLGSLLSFGDPEPEFCRRFDP